MQGTQLGNYTVLGELGQGGMGVVYTAQHSLMGKTAVIKVLRPEFSRSQEAVHRFFNEARAATQIDHPGIVDIYDFGYAPDGSAFIVMELLSGENLKARRERLGKLPLGDALRVVRQIADALIAAHAKNIIHRDLKPDNVFLVPDREVAGGERAKLLDFGIAKLTDPAQSGPVHTQTGAMIGTPTYMSPEQCEGAGQVDHRTDIYSLGCILYELLTSRPPFLANGVGGMIAAHLTQPPIPPRTLEPSLPMAVDAFIMRLLAKRPDERLQSMHDVYRELEGLAAQVAIGTGIGFDPTMSAPPPSMAGQPPGGWSPPQPPQSTLAVATGQTVPAASAAPAGGGRRLWLLIAGGVLLLGAGIAVAVVATRGDEAVASGADAGRQAAATHDAAAGPATADAAPIATGSIDASAAPGPIDAGAVVTTRIDAGKVAGKRIDAGGVVARPIDAGAPVASGHEREHRRFLTALRGKDPGKIAAAFAAIDSNSPHFAADKKKHDQIRDRFIADVRNDAERAAAASRCADLEKIARAAARAWKEAADAVRQVPCPAATPPPPPPDGGKKTAAQLNDEGEALLAQERSGAALRLFRLAFREDRRGRYVLNMCRALKAQGNRQAAITTCRRVSRVRSTRAEIDAAARIIRELELE